MTLSILQYLHHCSGSNQLLCEGYWSSPLICNSGLYRSHNCGACGFKEQLHRSRHVIKRKTSKQATQMEAEVRFLDKPCLQAILTGHIANAEGELLNCSKRSCPSRAESIKTFWLSCSNMLRCFYLSTEACITWQSPKCNRPFTQQRGSFAGGAVSKWSQLRAYGYNCERMDTIEVRPTLIKNLSRVCYFSIQGQNVAEI